MIDSVNVYVNVYDCANEDTREGNQDVMLGENMSVWVLNRKMRPSDDKLQWVWTAVLVLSYIALSEYMDVCVRLSECLKGDRSGMVE